MDDKLLEERLMNLKKSYDQVPIKSNKETIVNSIKREEKKRRRKRKLPFHLPYVASFIGVGVIAGMLIMQVIGIGGEAPDRQSNPNASDSPAWKSNPDDTVLTIDEVKKELDALRQEYEYKQKSVKEDLGIESFEYDIAPFIKEEINGAAKEAQLKLAYSVGDMKQLKMNLEKKIYDYLISPKQKLAEYEMQEISIETLQQLLISMSYFQSVYKDQLPIFTREIKNTVGTDDIGYLLYSLNDNQIMFENDTLKTYLKGASQNGFEFVYIDEEIDIKIDYNTLVNRLKFSLSDEAETFLTLRSNPVVMTQERILVSWKQLADILVEYEDAITSSNEEMIQEELIRDFSLYYEAFLKGRPESPIFDESGHIHSEVLQAYLYISRAYPNTQVAEMIALEEETLRKLDYVQPEDFTDKSIKMPPFLNEAYKRAYPQAEEKIYDSILPLSEELAKIYKEYKQSPSDELLKNLSPFAVMSLYYHAETEMDFDVQYELMLAEDFVSKDQFIAEAKLSPGAVESGFFNGYEFANMYRDENGNIIGVELHFNDSTRKTVFQFVNVNGVWKVPPMPTQ